MADADSLLLKDENTGQENTPDTQQAVRLVKWLGIIFLAMGIINLFPTINCINLLICISIGLGMFERHAWSRILGIIGTLYYFMVLSLTLFIYLFRSDYAEMIKTSFSKELTIVILITEIASFGLILYALFRPDVKELFKSKK